MKNISGNQYIKSYKNKVIIDSLELDDLLKSNNPPFMVFIEKKIRENIKNFRTAVEKVFKDSSIFYSFKANYLEAICKIIETENIGAELISSLELDLALNIGFSPEKILAGGPFFQNEFIEKCIINDIGEIVVYSLKNIKEINSIAEKYNKIQNICLRINSQKYDTRLGVKLLKHEVNQIEHYLSKCHNIQFKTILSHYSTQMNNVNQFTKNAEILIEAFKKLNNSGLKIENINFGGGFPEAVIMPKSQLEIIFNEIYSLLESCDLRYKKVYFEPGRYLVGDAGILIADVIDNTHNRWIFLNVGNNICPKFSRSSFRFYNASKIDQAHKYKTSIGGIIPTDQDVLAKNYFLNENIEIGDRILITNTGAYTLTFSNRFPYELPPIFLIKDNRVEKIFDPIRDHDFSLKSVNL
jgi:diaminopimelate decarboxylase